MINISLDFETYSEAKLKEVGAWAYSLHSTTEVLCMTYSIEGEKPILWLPGQPLPEFMFQPEKYMFHAWNNFFEYAIWLNVLCQQHPKLTVPNTKNWTDTAAKAAALALPRALDKCGEALDIEQDSLKNKRGKYLINTLCKPNRGKRNQDPELLAELHDYCKQDVVAEMAIAKKLRPLSRQERQIWELDQNINLRGVHFDVAAVDDALVMVNQSVTKLNAEVEQITGGVLLDVAKSTKVMAFCEGHGVTLENYQKAYLVSVLEDDIPPIVRRLIEIRQQTGKVSTAKYTKLKQLISSENRAHGLLMYHGATTGRWSGRLFQPQNLPRPSIKDTDQCISLFKHQDAELLNLIYGDSMEALSSCLRGMICAPKGKRLIVSDYSAIEARVLAWLAGQKDILKVFDGDGKIYEHTASKIYGISAALIDEIKRLVGKVATLALGFQGAVGAFQKMAEIYGLDISDEFAAKIVSDWRGENTDIVDFWRSVEGAAIAAVRNPGATFKCRDVRFSVRDGFLFCCIPSGRLLAYYDPKIQKGKFGKQQVTFMGTNTYTRKWERLETYGGKLVENITQATARDLMAEAMLRLDAKGYNLVLSVHDELMSEDDVNFGSLKEFEQIMCEIPPWARGLPIAAEGFECQRYRK